MSIHCARDLSIGDVCRAFLDFKESQMLSRELSIRTFDGYRRACVDVIEAFGDGMEADALAPDDFTLLRSRLAKRLKGKGLAIYMQSIRTMLTWAHQSQMIAAPNYGRCFDMPTRATVRRLRQRRHRFFKADEVRQLLDHAAGPIRTFILLGINCGYGQSDCSALSAASVTRAVADGVLTFDRPKTGIERETTLWPETIEALKATANTSGPAFLTERGNRWVRSKVHRDDDGQIVKITNMDAIGQQFGKVLAATGIDRRGFYSLRHTFRTVADDIGDLHATARIMGHEIPGMAKFYIAHISEDRLRRVTDHVRTWVFENNKEYYE